MKVNFIKELEAIKNSFISEAKNRMTKVHLNTFEIEICNRFLLLRVEGEDENGDTWALNCEVEHDRDENISYQQKIFACDCYEEY